MSLKRQWCDGTGAQGTSWAEVGYAAIASPIFLSMLVTGSLTRPGLLPSAPTRISARKRTCRAVERPSSIYCSAPRTHAVSPSVLVLFATSRLQSGKTSLWVNRVGWPAPADARSSSHSRPIAALRYLYMGQEPPNTEVTPLTSAFTRCSGLSLDLLRTCLSGSNRGERPGYLRSRRVVEGMGRARAACRAMKIKRFWCEGLVG